MKNILIGILLLISGLAYSQSSSSGTLANGSSGVTGGFQVYYLASLSDTTTIISPRKNESLFIIATQKFYKRTSYWALQATVIGASGTYLPLTGYAYTNTTSNALSLTGNNLTTAGLLSLSSNSLTTGALGIIVVNSTGAASNSQTGLSISTLGSNSNPTQTTYGLDVSNTHTGTASTNVAARFTASGGTNNYAIQAIGGNGGGLLLGDINSTNGAVWPNNVIPSTSNYALSVTSGGTDVNSGTTLRLLIGTVSKLSIISATSTFSNNIIQNSTVSTGTGATAGTQLNYNSLTTGNGIDASTSSLTTGMLAQFQSTSTALSGTSSCVQKIMSSGANANSGVTATGLNISVANTNATSGTNVALTLAASGAKTANYGLLVTSGNVGIGTSAPAYIFDIQKTLSPQMRIGNSTNSGATSEVADILLGFYSTNASTIKDGARIRAVKETDWTTVANENSALTFQTIMAGNNAERARIASNGAATFSPAVFAPSSGSTAFSPVSITATHAAINAASGAFKPLNITYTINNTGTASTATATGIFLNATETALNSMTHNLMDLQVGGVSKFRVNNIGYLFTSSNIAIGGAYIFTGKSVIASGTNGRIELSNNAGTDFNLLVFGGTTSSFPAWARDAANFRLVDASNGNASGLGIGESLPASAKLSVASTTQGFLPPRMTTTQKNAISSPAEGLIVYDTDIHKLYVYDGSTWQAAW